MHPHMAVAVSLSEASLRDPAGPGASPVGRLAITLERAALALAAALPLIAPAAAIGQTRIRPVTILDANGPDFGPADNLLFAVPVHGPLAGTVATLANSTDLQPLSAVTTGNVLGFLGDSAYTTVARRGDSIAGASVGGLLALGLDAHGGIAFVDRVPATGQVRVWTGDVASAVAPGATFSNLEPCSTIPQIHPKLGVNLARRVLLGCDVAHCGGTAKGVYLSQPGGATPYARIARTGLLAPGFDAGERFLFPAEPALALADDGSFVFTGSFSRPDDSLTEGGRALWFGTSTGVAPLAATNRAPIFGPSPTGAIVQAFALRDLRPSGVVAFTQEVAVPGASDRQHALIVGSLGGLAPIATTAQLLPGVSTDQTVRALGGRVNDRGDAVIVATLRQSSTFTQPDTGIWRVINGQIQPALALDRQTIDGIALRDLILTPELVGASIGSRGDVVFVADIGPSPVRRAVIAVNHARRLRVLLITGSAITLPGDATRTVTQIFLDESSPGPADRHGWFTLRVGFANATGTILVNPRACDADFDASGTLDPDDLADYIAAYFAPQPDPALVDVDFNGTVDPDDLSSFIAAYFAGC